MDFGVAAKTICKRAHDGVIRARAEHFIVDGRKEDGVELPQKFWWAEGDAALEQNWDTGDFSTWVDHDQVELKAYAVSFDRVSIEKMVPTKSRPPETPVAKAISKVVFIGHGGDNAWLILKEFINARLKLPYEEFNRVPVAGVATVERLKQMLDAAGIVFFVLTAEDELKDGGVQARMNVVHELGLFHGRLGFNKAIVLLEHGCNEFSNIHGLSQIRFPKNNIAASFEEIRQVLEREGVISPL